MKKRCTDCGWEATSPATKKLEYCPSCLSPLEEVALIGSFEIPAGKAWALAQLVKRLGFSDCRRNAVDDAEAYQQMEALSVLQKALAEAGFSPR